MLITSMTVMIVCVIGVHVLFPGAKMVNNSQTENISMNQMVFAEHSTAEIPRAQEPEMGSDFSYQIPSLTLNDEDVQLIQVYFEDGWMDTAANCAFDWVIEVDEADYLYHTECGILQDETGRCKRLEEAERIAVNEILKKYMH